MYSTAAAILIWESSSTHGVTQGRIRGLTGIAQDHLSEGKTGKRRRMASSIFEIFTDGEDMPPTAC